MRNKASRRHLDDEFMGFEDDERFSEISDSPYYDSVDDDDLGYLDNGYVSSLFDSYDDEEEVVDSDEEVIDDEFEDDEEALDMDLANPICPNCGARLNPIDGDETCPECGESPCTCEEGEDDEEFIDDEDALADMDEEILDDDSEFMEDEDEEELPSKGRVRESVEMDEELLMEAETAAKRSEAEQENDTSSFDVWSNVVENIICVKLFTRGMDKKEALEKAASIVKKNEPMLKDDFEDGTSPDEAAESIWG